MNRSNQVVRTGLLGILIVMGDSAFTYFTKPVLGYALPVNALLLLVLLVVLAKWGVKSVMPPIWIVYALGIGLVGVIIGMNVVDQFGVIKILSIGGAFCAFLVGFFALRWASNEDLYIRVLLAVGTVYVMICVVALLELAPSLFPIINAKWSSGGVLHLRPEITTDQNFQIFYLFPVVLGFVLPHRFWQTLGIYLLVAGGLFVLVRLQTMSGVLAFGSLIVMTFAVLLRNRTLSARAVLVQVAFMGVILYAGFDVLNAIAQLLILRFQGGFADEGYGRLLPTIYLLEHVFDLSYWIPRGYREYEMLFRDFPHSTATAMFLEGGILALYMWVVVFVLPLYWLIRLYLRRQLDRIGTAVMLAGCISFVLQMTLNIPFHEHIWFWAGAVLGTLCRIQVAVVSISEYYFGGGFAKKWEGIQ
jgi:hypothetical protein